MSDLISRKQAIDALEKWLHGLFGITEADGTATIFKTIRQLPPIQPDPHIGHWEPVGVAEVVGGESAMWGSAIAYHRCSECGEQALEEDGEEKLSDFCPHCGAKMGVTT